MSHAMDISRITKVTLLKNIQKKGKFTPLTVKVLFFPRAILTGCTDL